ncbi:MAG: IS4 family transposase [Candidatus Omnitrophota bacterium]
MNIGKTVFAQIMDFLPLQEFRKCVNRNQGNYKVQKFSCYDQFLCMAFAQLTYRESLRDIETCLRSMQSKLYHIGFRGKISRSTLADANETRNCQIYADFAQILIKTARGLYLNEPFSIELKQSVYALDATTINLCLSLFPWSHFRLKQGAIKLHTLLDLRGAIPSFIRITPARTHEINILKELIPEPGSFYTLDRGYFDSASLYMLNQAKSFFIIRARKDLNVRRLYSRPIDKSAGLKYDQTVTFVSFYPKKCYPEQLRRIKYFDIEKNKSLIFLTNNFILPALTITQLYKCRWQIELFFKWIKQHLRIKAFYGTSENAVKTQIWIAISIYVLIAIIKKQLKIKLNLYTILQIFSVTIFEKMPILQLLTDYEYNNKLTDSCNQLELFNL